MNRMAAVSLLLVLALAGAIPAVADDACTDFKWDVGKERQLFAGPATAVQAGADLKSAPAVVPNRFYRMQLQPQAEVAFVAGPGKKKAADGGYAGLATLKIPAEGGFRVSIDMPFWIDVVANGVLLPAKDFQGQHDCSAPHKIVEFELVGAQPFVLQFSGAATNSIGVTVTPVAARKF
jgi:hypothetical protein